MSTVELTRDYDGPDLIAALAEHGLTGQLVVVEDRLAVRVDGCDDTDLAHAIEDWLRDRRLPLVPLRIDDVTYALSPPAG